MEQAKSYIGSFFAKGLWRTDFSNVRYGREADIAHGLLKRYFREVNLVYFLSLFGSLAVSAQLTAAIGPCKISEENYDFLLVTDGPCVGKIGVGIEPKYEAECQRMTEPRRFRGTWHVEFETSSFTPVGRQDCIETAARDCVELAGKPLPWPSRWACPRKFELEFIGRRNVLPGFSPTYTIIVDEVISTKRLPNPPHEPDECDATAP